MKPYKLLTWFFAVLSVGLTVLLLANQSKQNEFRSNVRHTRDVVWDILSTRNLALRSAPSDAALYLEEVREHPELGKPRNALEEIISMERVTASKDIINYLRSKTGQDYGEDAGKWVDALRSLAQ